MLRLSSFCEIEGKRALRGQPGHDVGDFFRGQRVRMLSPVRHAAIGAAGDHRGPKRLVVDEREESRIDQKLADAFFEVASGAIALEYGLAAFRITQSRAIGRRCNSRKD